MYRLRDVDADDGRVHNVRYVDVAPLPRLEPQRYTEATAFEEGDRVLAVFPDTTSFYPARVVHAPDTAGDDYQLAFDDDRDDDNVQLEHGIEPGSVIPLPDGFEAKPQ